MRSWLAEAGPGRLLAHPSELEEPALATHRFKKSPPNLQPCSAAAGQLHKRLSAAAQGMLGRSACR